MMKLGNIVLILLIAFIPFVRKAVAQDSGRILTNADIVNMTKSGIGDPIIVLSIQKGATKFDTSPDALIKLKADGVSDAVMSAMMTSVSSPVAAAKAAPQDCSTLLDKAIASVGSPENVAAVRSIRLTATSVVTKPSGSTTFQAERVTVYPANIYTSIRSSNGMTGISVITPEFNYLNSGKMMSAVPATTLQEIDYGLKLELIYIAQHRNQYGCTLVGAEQVGMTKTARLEVKGEGVEGELYVDPETGKLLRTTFANGPSTQMVTDASDWRVVDGISVPFKRHVVTNTATTDLTMSEFQINPPINPTMFQPPAGQVAAALTLKVLQEESVPYTVQTNGGISTACNISGSTNTSLTATTYGNTTYGNATTTPNLRMNCKSTDTTIRWTHVLNAMLVQGSDGNSYIIGCDRAWAWSKCTPLRAGDTFLAKRSDKGFVVQSIHNSKENEATYSILQSKSMHE
jgi:hypothetical protein